MARSGFMLNARSASCPRSAGSEAGFTLIETLVALVVVAMSLAAVGTLFGANMRTTRALERRLELMETTRAIMTALPDRAKIWPGDVSGEIGGHRWRYDVLPFAADFVNPRQPAPWMPQAVVVSVESRSGQAMRIATIRLHRRPASQK